MKPFQTLTSRTVPLPRTDVDTDQIIPARFLTTTERSGLGDALFADWRYDENGAPDPGFVLNMPVHDGARVLVAGRNFGCGSSREHAPWALLDYGFRAVISSEIADIFRSNALKNGLLPIVVPEPFLGPLLEAAATVRISLEDCQVEVLESGNVLASQSFDIDPFARFCLMQGTDQLGFLLDRLDQIERWEQERSARS